MTSQLLRTLIPGQGKVLGQDAVSASSMEGRGIIIVVCFPLKLHLVKVRLHHFLEVGKHSFLWSVLHWTLLHYLPA